MTTSPRTIDELLFHFRTLTRKAPSDWERKFARSILRNAKRSGWEPSVRQLSVMRQMVNTMFASADPDVPDIELIETTKGKTVG